MTITFTMEELTQRFLHITKKIQVVVEEKNWLMFNHFLIERNDVIEFIEPRKHEMSEQDLAVMREAWEIQMAVTERMEGYRAEIQALRMQAQKVRHAGHRYQEQTVVGNSIHRRR